MDPARSTLVHDRSKLVPDTVAALRDQAWVSDAISNPQDFIVPHITRAARKCAIPLVVFPGIVRWIVPTFGIATVPFGVPLLYRVFPFVNG